MRTRRTLVPWSVVVFATLALAACGDSDDGDAASSADAAGNARPVVIDAVVGETIGPNAALYLVLRNDGGDDTIVTVDADVGEQAEMHEMRRESDGLLRMVRRDQVPVAAGSELVLQPGGDHVMLLGSGALDPGDTVTATLGFASGVTVTVDAPVVSGADLVAWAEKAAEDGR